jgi:hypothetical protein
MPGEIEEAFNLDDGRVRALSGAIEYDALGEGRDPGFDRSEEEAQLVVGNCRAGPCCKSEHLDGGSVLLQGKTTSAVSSLSASCGW